MRGNGGLGRGGFDGRASRLVGVTGCRARGEAGGVVRDDDDPDLGRGEARASLGGFRLVV